MQTQVSLFQDKKERLSLFKFFKTLLKNPHSNLIFLSNPDRAVSATLICYIQFMFSHSVTGCGFQYPSIICSQTRYAKLLSDARFRCNRYQCVTCYSNNGTPTQKSHLSVPSSTDQSPSPGITIGSKSLVNNLQFQKVSIKLLCIWINHLSELMQ